MTEAAADGRGTAAAVEGVAGLPSSVTVRVKLFVHGGTVSFAMRWSSSLDELRDHFTRNLATKKPGIVISTSDRLTHVGYGAISVYEFTREPLGSETALSEVRPA